ncbi:MAG: hypothetical protein QM725_05275 [Lacibacter sp.]
MIRSVIFLLFFIPLTVLAADSSVTAQAEVKKLRGYKRFLFNVVLLHPKMDSPLEKDLLRHFLIGSGSLYKVSDADFNRLKQTVLQHPQKLISDSTLYSAYRLARVDLNNDQYFGMALGNIVTISSTDSGEIISFADVYDFNKTRKGKRTLKNEFLTRTFRLLSPSSARAFIVTYNADGYFDKVN